MQVAMKPISTLMRPLPSVDVVTGVATVAHAERSDVCAVPAAGVVAEAMVALVLASCLLEQYSHDTYAAVLASVTASQTGVRK